MRTGGMRAALLATAPLMVLTLLIGSCSTDKDPIRPGDTAAPAATTNLAAGTVTTTSVQLTWTAPGDDGSSGTAGQYDIRYSTAAITAATFAAATAVTGEPAPVAAGTLQSMHVTDLTPGTDYYFAMKVADEVPNTSALSGVALAHTPTGPSNPPLLTSIDLPDSVCISSTDQYAQLAKIIATWQLGLARAYSSMGDAFFLPLESVEWQQTGDCWDYTYDLGSCSISYHACKTGSDYEYTLTYDGPCYGENHTNWAAYRFNFDDSDRAGAFYMYEPNTTDIAIAWVWTEAADELSGSYTFYEGDPGTAPVQSSIEWVKSADGNTTQVTFLAPDETRWESTFHQTPCSGTLTVYPWDDTGGTRWMDTDIAWNGDGTGYYRTYDDSGELMEEHLW